MKDGEESGAGGLELPFEAVKPWSAELLNSHTDLNAHRHTQEIFIQTHTHTHIPYTYLHNRFFCPAVFLILLPAPSPNWSEVYCAANYFGSLFRLLHLHRLNWGDTGTWPQLVHPFIRLPPICPTLIPYSFATMASPQSHPHLDSRTRSLPRPAPKDKQLESNFLWLCLSAQWHQNVLKGQ